MKSIYYILAAITAVNVIFFAMLPRGHEIGYTEELDSDILYGDVRLMNDYDEVKIFESRHVPGECYLYTKDLYKRPDYFCCYRLSRSVQS